MGLSSISACPFPLFYIDEDGRRRKIIEKIELAAEPLVLLTPYAALLCTQHLCAARTQADEGCVFHTASLMPFFIMHSKIMLVLPAKQHRSSVLTTSMP